MKILVICQYYYPEPFRISDICEELAKKGHDVTVVTGTPNYPMGEIYSGYEYGKRMDETIHGVNVHRCVTAPRKTGVLSRLINYFSYPIESIKYVKTLDDSYDIVFVNQLSPIMMAEAGIWYKKKYNKRLVLYCLDLWPESICIGGVKRGSFVYEVFKYISKRVYHNADKILVTSNSFRLYLNQMFNIPDETMEYLPQYAESQFLELHEKMPSEDFNLLFAGNIGAAQNLSTVIEAARILQNKKIKFHIVGDGSELKNIKDEAKGLSNVIFYGRKPLEEMSYYYEMADAMLITLIDDPVISLTLPGKVQTYMAAGKAIIGAVNGETAQVLKKSQGGFCGIAGNGEMLAQNIVELMDSKKALVIGKKNRDYYLKTFAKNKFIENLILYLS